MVNLVESKYILILIYISSLILGSLGAFVVILLGDKVGLMDYPKSRSSHAIPTPKGGGVGILASFVLVALVIDMPVVFWGPICSVSLLGLYGDSIYLSPRLRLIVQFGAAIILILGMTVFKLNLLLSFILLLFWAVFMVGTANFYNFMDGINGLATLTSFIAFGLLAIYLFLNDMHASLIPLSVSISLSCLGFLPFNLPRAKVFLGDVGSIFLGFIFAAHVFILSKQFLDVVCYAALLFPFYMDELTTMFVRIKGDEDLSKAHRKHIYQLLANEKEIAHWKISAGYGVVQFAVGITVLLLKPIGMIAVLIFLGLSALIFILVSIYIRVHVGRTGTTCGTLRL